MDVMNFAQMSEGAGSSTAGTLNPLTTACQKMRIAMPKSAG